MAHRLTESRLPFFVVRRPSSLIPNAAFRREALALRRELRQVFAVSPRRAAPLSAVMSLAGESSTDPVAVLGAVAIGLMLAWLIWAEVVSFIERRRRRTAISEVGGVLAEHFSPNGPRLAEIFGHPVRGFSRSAKTLQRSFQGLARRADLTGREVSFALIVDPVSHHNASVDIKPHGQTFSWLGFFRNEVMAKRSVRAFAGLSNDGKPIVLGLEPPEDLDRLVAQWSSSQPIGDISLVWEAGVALLMQNLYVRAARYLTGYDSDARIRREVVAANDTSVILHEWDRYLKPLGFSAPKTLGELAAMPLLSLEDYGRLRALAGQHQAPAEEEAIEQPSPVEEPGAPRSPPEAKPRTPERKLRTVLPWLTALVQQLPWFVLLLSVLWDGPLGDSFGIATMAMPVMLNLSPTPVEDVSETLPSLDTPAHLQQALALLPQLHPRLESSRDGLVWARGLAYHTAQQGDHQDVETYLRAFLPRLETSPYATAAVEALVIAIAQHGGGSHVQPLMDALPHLPDSTLSEVATAVSRYGTAGQVGIFANAMVSRDGHSSRRAMRQLAYELASAGSIAQVEAYLAALAQQLRATLWSAQPGEALLALFNQVRLLADESRQSHRGELLPSLTAFAPLLRPYLEFANAPRIIIDLMMQEGSIEDLRQLWATSVREADAMQEHHEWRALLHEPTHKAFLNWLLQEPVQQRIAELRPSVIPPADISAADVRLPHTAFQLGRSWVVPDTDGPGATVYKVAKPGEAVDTLQIEASLWNAIHPDAQPAGIMHGRLLRPYVAEADSTPESVLVRSHLRYHVADRTALMQYPTSWRVDAATLSVWLQHAIRQLKALAGYGWGYVGISEYYHDIAGHRPYLLRAMPVGHLKDPNTALRYANVRGVGMLVDLSPEHMVRFGPEGPTAAQLAEVIRDQVFQLSFLAAVVARQQDPRLTPQELVEILRGLSNHMHEAYGVPADGWETRLPAMLATIAEEITTALVQRRPFEGLGLLNGPFSAPSLVAFAETVAQSVVTARLKAQAEPPRSASSFGLHALVPLAAWGGAISEGSGWIATGLMIAAVSAVLMPIMMSVTQKPADSGARPAYLHRLRQAIATVAAWAFGLSLAAAMGQWHEIRVAIRDHAIPQWRASRAKKSMPEKLGTFLIFLAPAALLAGLNSVTAFDWLLGDWAGLLTMPLVIGMTSSKSPKAAVTLVDVNTLEATEQARAVFGSIVSSKVAKNFLAALVVTRNLLPGGRFESLEEVKRVALSIRGINESTWAILSKRLVLTGAAPQDPGQVLDELIRMVSERLSALPELENVRDVLPNVPAPLWVWIGLVEYRPHLPTDVAGGEPEPFFEALKQRAADVYGTREAQARLTKGYSAIRAYAEAQTQVERLAQSLTDISKGFRAHSDVHAQLQDVFARLVAAYYHLSYTQQRQQLVEDSRRTWTRLRPEDGLFTFDQVERLDLSPDFIDFMRQQVEEKDALLDRLLEVPLPRAEKGQIVLDVGTGTTGIDIINHLPPQQGLVVLSDGDPFVVKLLQETLRWNRRTDIRVVQMSASHLAVRAPPGLKVQHVVASSVLVHMHEADRRQFFEQANRLLAPDGTLWVYNAWIDAESHGIAQGVDEELQRAGFRIEADVTVSFEPSLGHRRTQAHSTSAPSLFALTPLAGFPLAPLLSGFSPWLGALLLVLTIAPIIFGMVQDKGHRPKQPKLARALQVSGPQSYEDVLEAARKFLKPRYPEPIRLLFEREVIPAALQVAGGEPARLEFLLVPIARAGEGVSSAAIETFFREAAHKSLPASHGDVHSLKRALVELKSKLRKRFPDDPSLASAAEDQIDDDDTAKSTTGDPTTVYSELTREHDEALARAILPAELDEDERDVLLVRRTHRSVQELFPQPLRSQVIGHLSDLAQRMREPAAWPSRIDPKTGLTLAIDPVTQDVLREAVRVVFDLLVKGAHPRFSLMRFDTRRLPDRGMRIEGHPEFGAFERVDDQAFARSIPVGVPLTTGGYLRWVMPAPPHYGKRVGDVIVLPVSLTDPELVLQAIFHEVLGALGLSHTEATLYEVFMSREVLQEQQPLRDLMGRMSAYSRMTIEREFQQPELENYSNTLANQSAVPADGEPTYVLTRRTTGHIMRRLHAQGLGNRAVARAYREFVRHLAEHVHAVDAEIVAKKLRAGFAPVTFTQPDGASITYERSGDGATSRIYVPGLGSTHEFWLYQIDDPALREGVKSIMLDARGHGRSELGTMKPEDYNLEVATDIARIALREGLTELQFQTHSIGARPFLRFLMELDKAERGEADVRQEFMDLAYRGVRVTHWGAGAPALDLTAVPAYPILLKVLGGVVLTSGLQNLMTRWLNGDAGTSARTVGGIGWGLRQMNSYMMAYPSRRASWDQWIAGLEERGRAARDMAVIGASHPGVQEFVLPMFFRNRFSNLLFVLDTFSRIQPGNPEAEAQDLLARRMTMDDPTRRLHVSVAMGEDDQLVSNPSVTGFFDGVEQRIAVINADRAAHGKKAIAPVLIRRTYVGGHSIFMDPRSRKDINRDHLGFFRNHLHLVLLLLVVAPLAVLLSLDLSPLSGSSAEPLLAIPTILGIGQSGRRPSPKLAQLVHLWLHWSELHPGEPRRRRLVARALGLSENRTGILAKQARLTWIGGGGYRVASANALEEWIRRLAFALGWPIKDLMREAGLYAHARPEWLKGKGQVRLWSLFAIERAVIRDIEQRSIESRTILLRGLERAFQQFRRVAARRWRHLEASQRSPWPLWSAAYMASLVPASRLLGAEGADHSRHSRHPRTDERYPGLIWNGFGGFDISASRAFRLHARRGLPTFIWGSARATAYLAALREEHRLTTTDYGELAAEDVLTLYLILRDANARGLTLEQLLQRLQQARDPRAPTVLRDRQAVRRGLQWLELKGFPIRQLGPRWIVSGAETGQILSLPAWPAQWQRRWKGLQGKESPAAIAARITLLYQSKGLSLSRLGRRAHRRPGRLAVELHSWRSMGKKPIEQMLEEWGAILGHEPVLLRTGHPRAALEPQVLRRLPAMTRGQRVHALRRLAGLSRASLAAMIGVDPHIIRRLENGRTQTDPYPELWPKLAEALDVDSFRILAGVARERALDGLAPKQQRELLRLAQGMTQEQARTARQPLYMLLPAGLAWPDLWPHIAGMEFWWLLSLIAVFVAAAKIRHPQATRRRMTRPHLMDQPLPAAGGRTGQEFVEQMGRRFRRVRERLKRDDPDRFRQFAVARRLGIQNSQLRDFEEGRFNPPFSRVLDTAAELGMPVGLFMDHAKPVPRELPTARIARLTQPEVGLRLEAVFKAVGATWSGWARTIGMPRNALKETMARLKQGRNVTTLNVLRLVGGLGVPLPPIIQQIRITPEQIVRSLRQRSVTPAPKAAPANPLRPESRGAPHPRRTPAVAPTPRPVEVHEDPVAPLTTLYASGPSAQRPYRAEAAQLLGTAHTQVVRSVKAIRERAQDAALTTEERAMVTQAADYLWRYLSRSAIVRRPAVIHSQDDYILVKWTARQIALMDELFTNALLHPLLEDILFHVGVIAVGGEAHYDTLRQKLYGTPNQVPGRVQRFIRSRLAARSNKTPVFAGLILPGGLETFAGLEIWWWLLPLISVIALGAMILSVIATKREQVQRWIERGDFVEAVDEDLWENLMFSVPGRRRRALVEAQVLRYRTRDDTAAGQVQYRIRRGVLTIDGYEVDEAVQGQGLGTAILAELIRRHPEAQTLRITGRHTWQRDWVKHWRDAGWLESQSSWWAERYAIHRDQLLSDLGLATPVAAVLVHERLKFQAWEAERLSASGRTVEEALADLDGRLPQFTEELVLVDGDRFITRPGVTILLDGRNIEELQGFATPLAQGQVISFELSEDVRTVPWARSEIRTITVDGVPVTARIIGDPDAPSAVLLKHGGLTDSRYFWRQYQVIHRLPADWKLIVTDSREHGLSHDTRPNHEIGEQPNFLKGSALDDVAWLKALGVKVVVPIGHSMGGVKLVSFFAHLLTHAPELDVTVRSPILIASPLKADGVRMRRAGPARSSSQVGGQLRTWLMALLQWLQRLGIPLGPIRHLLEDVESIRTAAVQDIRQHFIRRIERFVARPDRVHWPRLRRVLLHTQLNITGRGLIRSFWAMAEHSVRYFNVVADAVAAGVNDRYGIVRALRNEGMMVVSGRDGLVNSERVAQNALLLGIQPKRILLWEDQGHSSPIEASERLNDLIVAAVTGHPVPPRASASTQGPSALFAGLMLPWGGELSGAWWLLPLLLVAGAIVTARGLLKRRDGTWLRTAWASEELRARAIEMELTREITQVYRDLAAQGNDPVQRLIKPDGTLYWPMPERIAELSAELSKPLSNVDLIRLQSLIWTWIGDAVPPQRGMKWEAHREIVSMLAAPWWDTARWMAHVQQPPAGDWSEVPAELRHVIRAALRSAVKRLDDPLREALWGRIDELVAQVWHRIGLPDPDAAMPGADVEAQNVEFLRAAMVARWRLSGSWAQIAQWADDAVRHALQEVSEDKRLPPAVVGAVQLKVRVDLNIYQDWLMNAGRRLRFTLDELPRGSSAPAKSVFAIAPLSLLAWPWDGELSNAWWLLPLVVLPLAILRVSRGERRVSLPSIREVVHEIAQSVQPVTWEPLSIRSSHAQRQARAEAILSFYERIQQSVAARAELTAAQRQRVLRQLDRRIVVDETDIRLRQRRAPRRLLSWFVVSFFTGLLAASQVARATPLFNDLQTSTVIATSKEAPDLAAMNPSILQELVGRGFTAEQARVIVNEQRLLMTRLAPHLSGVEHESLHRHTFPLTVFSILREMLTEMPGLLIILGAFAVSVVATVAIAALFGLGFLEILAAGMVFMGLEVLVAILPAFILMLMPWGLTNPFSGHVFVKPELQKELFHETVVHETAHLLLPGAALGYFNNPGHDAVQAMGELRSWEFYGRHVTSPSATGRSTQFATAAWRLAESLHEPRAAWRYLHLLADGKRSEEAEAIVKTEATRQRALKRKARHGRLAPRGLTRGFAGVVVVPSNGELLGGFDAWGWLLPLALLAGMIWRSWRQTPASLVERLTSGQPDVAAAALDELDRQRNAALMHQVATRALERLGLRPTLNQQGAATAVELFAEDGHRVAWLVLSSEEERVRGEGIWIDSSRNGQGMLSLLSRWVISHPAFLPHAGHPVLVTNATSKVASRWPHLGLRDPAVRRNPNDAFTLEGRLPVWHPSSAGDDYKARLRIVPADGLQPRHPAHREVVEPLVKVLSGPDAQLFGPIQEMRADDGTRHVLYGNHRHAALADIMGLRYVPAFAQQAGDVMPEPALPMRMDFLRWISMIGGWLGRVSTHLERAFLALINWRLQHELRAVRFLELPQDLAKADDNPFPATLGRVIPVIIDARVRFWILHRAGIEALNPAIRRSQLSRTIVPAYPVHQLPIWNLVYLAERMGQHLGVQAAIENHRGERVEPVNAKASFLSLLQVITPARSLTIHLDGPATADLGALLHLFERVLSDQRFRYWPVEPFAKYVAALERFREHPERLADDPSLHAASKPWIAEHLVFDRALEDIAHRSRTLASHDETRAVPPAINQPPSGGTPLGAFFIPLLGIEGPQLSWILNLDYLGLGLTIGLLAGLVFMTIRGSGGNVPNLASDLEPALGKMLEVVRQRAGPPGKNRLLRIAIDGQSGDGKTDFSRALEQTLQAAGYPTAGFAMDRLMHERTWRIAVQKVIIIGEPLDEEDERVLRSVKPMLLPFMNFPSWIMNHYQPGTPFEYEGGFFHHARLLALLSDVAGFKQHARAGDTLDIELGRGYDQQTKGDIDLDPLHLTPQTLFIVEGKYVNWFAMAHKAPDFYDLHIRIDAGPRRTRHRFLARTHQLSPETVARQTRFFDLALVPSFRWYNRWIQHVLDYRVDQRDSMARLVRLRKRGQIEPTSSTTPLGAFLLPYFSDGALELWGVLLAGLAVWLVTRPSVRRALIGWLAAAIALFVPSSLQGQESIEPFRKSPVVYASQYAHLLAVAEQAAEELEAISEIGQEPAVLLALLRNPSQGMQIRWIHDASPYFLVSADPVEGVLKVSAQLAVRGLDDVETVGPALVRELARLTPGARARARQAHALLSEPVLRDASSPALESASWARLNASPALLTFQAQRALQRAVALNVHSIVEALATELAYQGLLAARAGMPLAAYLDDRAAAAAGASKDVAGYLYELKSLLAEDGTLDKDHARVSAVWSGWGISNRERRLLSRLAVQQGVAGLTDEFSRWLLSWVNDPALLVTDD
ncbi:MAG: hypothetical protein COV75_03460, partial [Candidatus Omnitrophica bacterium CG11_big_fil_rev_8_21_14_0_20_63_9]